MIKNKFLVISLWLWAPWLLVSVFPIICFSAPARLQGWEFYGKSKGGSVYYYSKKNITEAANTQTVWSYKTITDNERKEKIESIKKYNPEESIKYQQYDYSMSRIEIDCKKRLHRVKEIVSYNKEGKILERGVFDNDWESITAQSMADILYQKVCAAEKNPSMEKSDKMPVKIKSAEIKSSTTKKTDKHDWVQYGRPLNGSVYAYDKAGITYKEKNLVWVWRKLTYSDAHREKDIQKLVKSGLYTKAQLEKLSYDLTLHEIDCKNKRSRLLNIICYDRYDNVLLKRSNHNAKWKHIVPESQEDLLRKQICK